MTTTPPPNTPASPPPSVAKLLADPMLRIWAAFIVLFPFYVLPSGLPQPADAILLVLAPAVFRRWDGRLPIASRRALIALAAFAVYATLSAVVWSIWLGTVSLNLRIGFLLSPIFYIYNAMVFAMRGLVLYRLRGDRFVEITVRAAALSVLIQIPVSFIFGHKSLLRSTGMFNNPNQFGYYAVLSASIIVLGQKRARLSTMQATLGIVACSYLALISASKAGIAATALILIVSLITRLRTVVLASLVAAGLLMLFDPEGGHDQPEPSIASRTTKSYDFAEERGYDRIGQHPENWIVGAGEGGYYRYADTGKIGEHELHSSAGTLFFCYGVVGSALFVWFVFQLLRVARFRQVFMLGPAIAYGLSHQGLRVTLLWIFLALFLSVGARQAKPRGPPGSSRPELPV